MPGCALYDFGDMVRTTTSPTLEDEQDLAKVQMRMPMFKALARGYLETAGAFLTKGERSSHRLRRQTHHLHHRDPVPDRLSKWRHLFPRPSTAPQPRSLSHAVSTHPEHR